MLGFFLKPFSEAPLNQTFRQRSTTLTVLVISILIYCGLTAWNIFTQGHNNTFTTKFLSNYVPTNSTITCQPAQIEVGNQLFASPNGLFPWSVGGVYSSDGSTEEFVSGVQYFGDNLGCNITGGGILYQFAEQTFLYGVCGNCTTSGSNAAKAGTQGHIVYLCANFDLSRDNLPTWTRSGQQTLQNKIFGIGSIYQLINFPNNSFPASVIPPYGESTAPAPTDTSATPRQVLNLNIWSAGFVLQPDTNDANATYIVNGNSVSGLSAVFDATVPSQASGLQLDVLGIGGIRLGSTLSASQSSPAQPPVIAQLRSFSFTALDALFQTALIDLNNRPLSSSYVCTVTGREWKNPIALVALVLGNNAGLFGFALTILLILGKYREDRMMYATMPSGRYTVPETPPPPFGSPTINRGSIGKPAYSPLGLPVETHATHELSYQAPSAHRRDSSLTSALSGHF